MPENTVRYPSNESIDSYQQYKQDIAIIFAETSGQESNLVIPRHLIDFFKSLNVALLFNQIMYWSQRTRDPEGWFYKTYSEWDTELSLSEYQIRHAIQGPLDGYVETTVRKARGNPTVHYRLKWDHFSESIVKFLRERSLRNFGNLTYRDYNRDYLFFRGRRF